MQMRQIEIDFDIHKKIEMERKGFDEPPYLALRRLLNLPEAEEQDKPLGQTPTAEPNPITDEGRPFIEGGVVVPHGSLARMRYQRGQQVYEGRFVDGRLTVNGRSFEALSPAAKALAVTKDGKHPKELNGWLYWEVQLPGESEWKKMNDLRKEFARNLNLKIEL